MILTLRLPIDPIFILTLTKTVERLNTVYKLTAREQGNELRELNRDFLFDLPIPTRFIDRAAFLCKVLPRLGRRCSQRRRKELGSPPASTQGPERTLFPGASADTAPRQTSAVIEICSALHAPYPAGDGNAAIFCSMFPKSRLVSWLSASSNQ